MYKTTQNSWHLYFWKLVISFKVEIALSGNVGEIFSTLQIVFLVKNMVEKQFFWQNGLKWNI